MNIGAFNLGNAIGAALGGGVIAAGLSLPLVSIAGAAASGIGLFAILISFRNASIRDARLQKHKKKRMRWMAPAHGI